MTEETAMRIEHLRQAMRKAECYATKGDWAQSIYHLDEAHLLMQALDQEDQLNRKRQERQTA